MFKFKHVFLPIIVVISLSASCTKDLPKIESESIKETVFSLYDFSNPIEVTLTEEPRPKNTKKTEIILIKNSFKKVRLTYHSKNKNIKKLIEGLVVSVPKETPSTMKIDFSINEEHLVARTTMPNILNPNQYASNGNLYLFQYPINSFGIKRRSKNANDEETRNIEFHQTEKSEATHLKINSPFKETVELGGLDELSQNTQQQILDLETLEKNVWSESEILEIFNSGDTLSNGSFNNIGLHLSKLQKYSIRVGKNNLYIQEVLSIEDLSEVEKRNIELKIRSVILHHCPSYIKKQTNIKKCFVRTLYKTKINPVIIRPKKDTKGQELALIELDTSVNESTIIQLTRGTFNDVNTDRESLLLDTYNKKVLNKNDIDFEAEYIYLPSTHGAPRDVVNAMPFFQGQEKIVKIQMKEEGLFVYQEDPDTRFQENEHNKSPVLLISGRHIDLSCKEKNKDGICIEKNNVRKKWSDKQFFEPNLHKFKHYQVNNIDLFNLSTPCIYEVDSKVSYSDIKKGVINVEQIKTYKVNKNSRCMVELFYGDNLKSSSFTVKHFYSLVRLSDIASKDYKSFNYPVENQNAFGFFKDSNKMKGQDYTISRERTKHLLNRFNPEKEKIIFKLSEEFGRKENKYILDATFDVIKKINNSLKLANTKIKIELQAPTKIFPGDLRNNSIVLITDPLANGLLGYGPSVTNPRTGEIVQAHTNMYLGVLRTGARRIYKYMEEMAKEKPIPITNLSPIAQREIRQANTVSMAKKNYDKAFKKLISTQNQNEHYNIIESKHDLYDMHQHKHLEEKYDFIDDKDYMPLVSRKDDLENIFGTIHSSDFSNLENSTSLYEKKLAFYAENNAFHIEALNFNSLGKVIIPEIKEIPGIIKGDGTLVAYEDLSKEQREKAIKIIVTQGYKTTLAHEIGHNLGLRHNFKGSYDKENFYTKAELPHDCKHHSPQYSSIMDYGANSLNELPVLGKYDIAALRYGYAQEIELNDGSIQKIKGGDVITPLNRKKYMFCTDQNAGGSIECNRFDEGSSIEEIVDHYIHLYKNRYKVLNTRDGRESFKSYDFPRYMWSVRYTMTNIRNALDKYNLIRSIFGQEVLDGKCPEKKWPLCATINDIYRASKKAGDFFFEIMSTPDKTCVVEKAGKHKLVPFTKLYSSVRYQTQESVITSCFHPDIAKGLESGEKIIAEGGKLINDLSGNHSLIRSQFDIDIRGIWADKLFATKMLFGRFTGGQETNGLSPLAFTEHPDFNDKLFEFIQHLTLGTQLPQKNLFKTKDKKDIQVDYQLYDDFYLPSRPTWYPTLLFGFPPYSGANLNELILKIIAKVNRSTDPNLREYTRSIKEIVSVYKKSYLSENVSSDITNVYIDSTSMYLAGPENKLAYMMIDIINSAEELKNIPSDLALTVLNYKSKRVPVSYSQDEAHIFKLQNDLLEGIINYLSQNPPELTLEELVKMTKNKEVAQAIYISQKIGLQRIQEILAQKIKIYETKVECRDAIGVIVTDNEEENVKICQNYDILWEKNRNILVLKSLRKLDGEAKKLKERIKKLPSYNSSEFNFVEQLMNAF